MYYLSKTSDIDFKSWDVGTVTASDFTVEWDIPRALYEEFEKEHAEANSKRDKPISEGEGFEQFLKKEFEELMSNQKSVLNPNDDTKVDIKIANITFAFNNASLLRLLKERGTCVAQGQFVKLPAVDAKINDLMDTQEELDNLTKPVSAFITFETQEGYERACEFEGKFDCNGKLTAENKWRGYDLYFNEAPEPTNIIWEHRQNTISLQRKRTTIVGLIIVFLLVLAFLAFYYLKQATVLNYRRYPPTTNCSDIYAIYKVNENGY